MSKNTNIIEINGQQYNSLTGQLVGSGSSPVPVRTMDGVIKPQKRPKATAIPVTKNHSAKVHHTPVKKPATAMTRVPASHIKSHAPEPAKTLMRRSVARPVAGKSVKVLAQGNLDAIRPAVQPIAPKLSSTQVDPAKLARAKQTAKSELISRFSNYVRSRQIEVPAHPAVSSIPAGNTTPVVTSAANPSLDVFARAIDSAATHQQKTSKQIAKQSKRSKRRSLQAVTAGLALVIVGGFVFYQNLGAIHLHMASARAGFSASLPSYRPSGFSLGTITSTAGNVAVAFHSNSDQRTFAISERPSAWDSQTLLSSFVSGAAGQNYQTVQAAGRTVYIYGKNNATWVNGGIWYQVQTGGALSSQQLIDLASSI